jgi:hypothetical protein
MHGVYCVQAEFTDAVPFAMISLKLKVPALQIFFPVTLCVLLYQLFVCLKSRQPLTSGSEYAEAAVAPPTMRPIVIAPTESFRRSLKGMMAPLSWV